jgi:hypothetical protein
VSNCATRSAPSSNSCAEPSRSCARNSIRRTSRSEAVDSDIKTQAAHSGSSLRPVRGAAVAFGRRCENVSCCRSERTFGTRMAAAGVPPRTLQEWMGHRDFTSTPSTRTTSPANRKQRAKVLELPRIGTSHASTSCVCTGSNGSGQRRFCWSSLAGGRRAAMISRPCSGQHAAADAVAAAVEHGVAWEDRRARAVERD